MNIFAAARQRADSVSIDVVQGAVAQSVGLSIEAEGVSAPLGAMARITTRAGHAIETEIVGFRGRRSLLMPLSHPQGIAAGDQIRLHAPGARVPAGPSMLGRVVDAMGRPLDGLAAPRHTVMREVFADPQDPMKRPPIRDRIVTGVRAIDAMFTCGRGQRVGLFAGSGVGKSSLLGMITRFTDADAIVLCLVGERGRELRDFLDHDLGEEGRSRACVVCATSDATPLLRVRAAFAATAIAEQLRDEGRHVLLLVDSVTRLALAQREIGLAAGEPPTTRGFTPSVFALLPRLLERAGTSSKGSITAFYSVLVEGDDTNEPVADAVRGLIDGHIWLDRELANRGHFPAIRLDDSISRLMDAIADPQHMEYAIRLRRLYTAYRRSEDLVRIGAYTRGVSPELDEAIARMPAIEEFLRQPRGARCDFEESLSALRKVLEQKPGRP